MVWEAVIRARRLNDASAPLHLTFATPKGKPAKGAGMLRISPAMAAGVTDKLWSVADIVTMMDAEKSN
jgi:hypothetical protein